MVSSMTGFARKQAQGEWGSLVWEIRSLNHRYLECTFKIPNSLRELEPELKSFLQKKIARGSVECHLRFHPGQAFANEISVNEVLLNSLKKAYNTVSKHLNQSDSLKPIDALKWPGVLHYDEEDLQFAHVAIFESFRQAVDNLSAVRQKEGLVLKEVVLDKVKQLNVQIKVAETYQDDLIARLKERMQNRVEPFKMDLDEARLEQEIVILAQKSDVSEELDRLNAHMQEIENIVNQGSVIGRRLDFLSQELNREVNTLGAKSCSNAISKRVVEMKVLIEQLREQAQNIE